MSSKFGYIVHFVSGMLKKSIFDIVTRIVTLIFSNSASNLLTMGKSLNLERTEIEPNYTFFLRITYPWVLRMNGHK